MKIPHFSEWSVVKEEFMKHWSTSADEYGYIKYAVPLMEVTRSYTFNGIVHLVAVLEWGKPIYMRSTEEGQAIMAKHGFAIDVLHRAQQEVSSLLPVPKCRPTVNIFDIKKSAT